MRAALMCLLLAAFVCPAFPGELNVAARAGDLERVKALLAAGASVAERDSLGGTPLHDAAWAGDLAIVQYLLDKGADPNARHLESGSTPLDYAVITNHRDVVEMFLLRGSRVGPAALHLAANRGYGEVVRLLIAKGADVNARDSSGSTPLDEAAWKGQLEVASILLKHGAEANVHNPNTGVTPLHESAVKGHCEIAALLIAHGADVTARDNNGSTALDEALRYRHGPVVSLLLEKSKLATGQAPVLRQLLDAVMRGQTDMVTLLLEKGAGANAVTPNGSTLLHDAALKGYRDIVAALLAGGAKVNSRNAAGGTALHDAALAGSQPVVTLLLERGADVNAIDVETGATPLHHAASWGRTEVLTVLMDHGAELNLKNKAGQTPLRAALVNEQKETAGLLRRRGAKE